MDPAIILFGLGVGVLVGATGMGGVKGAVLSYLVHRACRPVAHSRKPVEASTR